MRLCLEHLPFPGEACIECEVRYQESRGTIKTPLWFVLGFALPWLTLLLYSNHLPSWSARSGGFRAITTSFPMLDVLIMVSVLAVFAGKAAMGVAEHVHRRRFLASSPGT